MSAPASVDDFLIVLARSNLVEGNRLDGFLRRMNSVPEEPEQLAEQMAQAGLLTHFQVTHLLKGRWLRFFIGPYKVLDRIGAGTSGAVYLCEHQKLRRRVAIKVLLSTKAQDQSMVMRFQREARAVAALDHPNIVHAFDVGCLEGMHYLVMEYINGVSLLQLVKTEGPLPPRKVAEFLRQAAIGMQHAHQAGLVHRDLKPANLMVDQCGVIKILDLGLALMTEEDMDLTRGAVLGSAAYMAPEQAMDSHHVDARADIYALGGTFYQCLTGRQPQADSFLVPPPRPIGGDARLFSRLMDLFRRMMSTGPADRPQTAAAVAAEVASWPMPPLIGNSAAARATILDKKASDAPTEPILQRTRVTKISPDTPARANVTRLAQDKQADSAPVMARVKPHADTPVVAARRSTLPKENAAAPARKVPPLSSGTKPASASPRPVPAGQRPVGAAQRTVAVAPSKAAATRRPAPSAPVAVPAVRGIGSAQRPATVTPGRHWLWLVAGAGLSTMIAVFGHLLRIW